MCPHIKPQVPTLNNEYDFTQNDRISIFNSLKGGQEIRFRAPRCVEDWRLRMNGGSLVEDSSRGSFLLPGKRKVNIKYSRSDFVWMKAESHVKPLLLTEMRHIGRIAVILCIRKERCYLHEQFFLTGRASVGGQDCRFFHHQTQKCLTCLYFLPWQKSYKT